MDFILNTAGSFVGPLRKLKDNTQTLKRKIEELKSREGDVDTELENAACGPSRKKRKMEVQKWKDNVSRTIKEFESLEQEVQATELHHVRSGTRLAEKVESITKEVDELLEQGNFPRGLFHEGVHEYTGQLLLTSEEKNSTLERNLNRFWESFKNASSIGIYGMGGVGKTIMAKHINDKLAKDSNFEVYWVTVSQESSIDKLQNDIAKVLNLEFSWESDKTKRAAELFHKLLEKGKVRRVVVILDDVWKKIDVREVGIPVGTNGCILVITSRSKEVCCQSECQDIIKVETLSNEEAWDLFSTKLGPIKLSPEVEEVAQKVAEKCDGLPLAIIAIAGSLRGVTDICEWRTVLVELNGSRMEQEGMEMDKVFEILNCSFNRLRNSTLQECFLYCSLYPEDFEIPRSELIDMFIREGLLNRTSRQDNFDQGYTILKKLESACLLERGLKSSKFVRMHDVIRDMALRIKKGKYMVKAGIRLGKIPVLNEWEEGLEKISLAYNPYVSELSCGISPPNFPRLSTLSLRSCFQLKLIPDSFFDQMPGLRVLDLRQTELEKLPSSVSKLEKLNALLVGGCRQLNFVPPVGELMALTELNIEGTRLKELPQGIENLTKLKRLTAWGSLIEAFPAALGRLKQLEEFSGVFNSIHDFNRLIRGTQQDAWKLNSYIIDVGKNAGMQRYVIRLDIIRRTISFNGGSIDIEKRDGNKEKIILPSNVVHIEFERSGLGSFLFDHLLLQLNNNASGPSTLNLRREYQLEGIMREERTVETEEQYKAFSFLLANLESLALVQLPNFHGLAYLPPGTFSRLKSMTIIGCNKIKTLIPRYLVENLQNLKQLSVSHCKQIEKIIEGNKDELGDMDSADVTLPRLEILHLKELPALQRISNGKMNVPLISYIYIHGVGKVNRMPLDFPLLDESHFTIRVEREWWESLEWEHPDTTRFLERFVQFFANE